MSLLASLTLMALMPKAAEPYHSHLFGRTRTSDELPSGLPYKMGKIYPHSEMSFKCRSSSSLSSQIPGVPQRIASGHLLPTCPEKALSGLGIYCAPPHAIKYSSTPSFLTPRPSLHSIRSHTTVVSGPRSSPLPALPAYFPEKYRHSESNILPNPLLPKRIQQRPYTTLVVPRRSSARVSGRPVRLVPPTPTFRVPKAAMLDRSESLSSVYSRSISGESHMSGETCVARPGLGSNRFGRNDSYSSSSIVKSPLGQMHYAKRPNLLVWTEERDLKDEINNAADLQAKLPAVELPWQVRG
ncbi:hypothetical protein LTR62_008491 [Meristemomyces frigidus]|uniref:Uncharacterized protein n=1 Tax=Meristemomyces frigidus TaxID=1508187 RepID=A0AAN7YR21_9PEZI|nr:hypothetical protein LTR62_008491 [Meristemomyces frigidus]